MTVYAELYYYNGTGLQLPFTVTEKLIKGMENSIIFGLECNVSLEEQKKKYYSRFK